jgi:hypothetical protein
VSHVRPADPDDAEAIQEFGRTVWHAAADVFGPDRVDRVVSQW